ncbi:response regulator transcription factor [Streptomyces sp. NPDC085540]|uniref:response regulator transcription factor n=1 Tax=Streptomyces sp. NPDC085540 TaxID=3365730 RepID=UPI0037D23AAF
MVENESIGEAESATIDHAAHVEQALLQAGALIESTVSICRQRSEDLPLVRTDGSSIVEVLQSLIPSARHTVCAMLAEADQFTYATLGLLADAPAHVTVRMLCTADVADSSLASPAGGLGERFAVRVSRSELRPIVVVDGVAALVRAEGTAGPALVVRDVATVRALELFFASAWSRGHGLAGHRQLSPRLRTELAREILERLLAGLTDETAARELNVSLRTYRRYVAEIIRELDANSRFQAGVRAVELGLRSQ